MAEPATIDACLRVVPEFRADERGELTERLQSKLGNRISRWSADQVEMELSVKDRDTPQQRVTLEVWIAARGRTRFVATSAEPQVYGAVTEARDDMHRQIDRFLTKRESKRRR